jgi:hypothetical protein
MSGLSSGSRGDGTSRGERSHSLGASIGVVLAALVCCGLPVLLFTGGWLTSLSLIARRYSTAFTGVAITLLLATVTASVRARNRKRRRLHDTPEVGCRQPDLKSGLLAHLNQERSALAAILASKAYSALFLVLAGSVSALYMFLLPSLPLGGPVPFAIRFLTPIQAAFSLIFGVLISLVATLNVYALRARAPSTKGLALGSVLASLVNGLCCTPVIPSLIAMTGVSTSVLYEVSPRLQAFFEFNYPYFYALSAVLLLLSVHYLSRSISACCGTGRGGLARAGGTEART